MAEPTAPSRSLTMFDRLALATFLVVLVVGVGLVVWRNTGMRPVADTFRDIETNVAQRRIVAQLPERDAAEAVDHAQRLARLELKLARAKAVDAEVSDLAARFAELRKWSLDQLDEENRARLDRRLRAIEADPVLNAAQAAYQTREKTLQNDKGPEAEVSWQKFRAPLLAAEARQKEADALREQVYGTLDRALAQANTQAAQGATQGTNQASKPGAGAEQCMQCHRGIDRDEFDRALLGQLASEEESKRLTMRLAEARDLLGRRPAGDATVPSLLANERLGSVWLVVALMLLSTAVAALSLGLLERSWRIGLNATYAGVGLTLLTGVTMAMFTPVVPRVQPVKLTASEIDQYCSHPRLDLYVGASSAHPVAKFACADCHHGDTKSTRFGAAGHQPSDMDEVAAWTREHNWKASDCGPSTLLATRFTQSGCLKCHTQVTDTIRHGVQEEAPKLLAGQRLFTQLGCQGCHEVQGQTPETHLVETRPVGPSLRRVAEKVDEAWLRRWIAEPRAFREHTAMPHFYGLSNNHPDVLPADQKTFPAVEIAAIGHYLRSESERASKGEDVTTAQVTRAWRQALARLTKEPPSPALFDAVRRAAKELRDQAVRQHPLAQDAVDDAHRQLGELLDRLALLDNKAPEREALLGTVNTLATEMRTRAKPVPLAERLVDGEGATVTLDPARKGDKVKGRLLFTEKGCLACHMHVGTTKALKVDGKTAVFSVRSEAQHGPDLSRLSEKFEGVDAKQARRWLTQWILNPTVHSPGTLMPVTHLTADQADDVATWLLSVKPSEPAAVADPGTPALKDLAALARLYLAKAPGLQSADAQTLTLQGDKLGGLSSQAVSNLPNEAEERLLTADKITPERLQWYVGKKAIARLGCYGCHDIPGFETAKPNSVPLSDWGRKGMRAEEFAGLADYFRAKYAIVPKQAGNTRAEVAERLKALEEKFDAVTPAEKAERTGLKAKLEAQDRLVALEAKATTEKLSDAEKDELTRLQPQRLFEASAGKQPYEELFVWALEHHRREGFLSAKLTDPRAADAGQERGWLERLAMPQYRFARPLPRKDEQDPVFAARVPVEEATAREATMTFVLGLVQTPVPEAKRPDPRSDSAIEARGRAILDKYNCAGCHQVQPGVYEFTLTPALREQLLSTHNKAALEDAASWLKDHIYPGHSGWNGTTPPLKGLPGNRLRAFGFYDADLTETSGEGKNDVIYLTEALRVPTGQGDFRDLRAGMLLSLPRGSYQGTPGYGGAWTEAMIPYLSRKDSTNFPKTEPGKARGVLAPPLLREGERVQSEWLYKFLLEPGVIRPENYMLLRMPRFALSQAEARALVDYFTVVARRLNPRGGPDGPYTAIEQQGESYWKQQATRYEAVARAKLTEIEAALKDPTRQAQHAELKKVADGLKARLAPGPGTSYERAAFQLLTDKNLCISCHNVGPIVTPAPKGPNLALGAERLRPEWTEQWIANPRRLYAYSPLMPQNFPNATSRLEWQYQDLFVGSPLEQTRAARDLIMDLPRLNRQAPTYKPPVATPTGENK